MKIYHGVDLVEVPKFREVAQRHPQLIQEVFTERERAYCRSMKDTDLRLAGRLAAKESYVKALGTGFLVAGVDHLFQEIEVLHTSSGKPEIAVRGWAAKVAKKKKIQQCSVSISHTPNYTVATVILVGS